MMVDGVGEAIGGRRSVFKFMLIDVVWLKGRRIHLAFISSGGDGGISASEGGWSRYSVQIKGQRHKA